MREDVTWRELLEQGQHLLEQSHVPDADLDAWYLLEYASHKNRGEYFLHREETAPQKECEQFLQLVQQRCQRIPLQYVTGCQEFMGLPFLVDSRVLVPRQDTELLVETLLPLAKGKKVLDLCTGSGCIAISLDKLGETVQVDGVDLSADALQVAQKNAKQLDSRVRLWQSDLFENVTEQYDIIVSNPPYIPSGTVDTLMPEVRGYEPCMALDGGRDGLDFYRQITARAGQYLLPGGRLAVEIGYDQREAVVSLFEQNHFRQVVCHQDLCGKDRIVMGTIERNEVKKCLTD
jgi:release factor glutamine methyltransferase